MDLRIADIDVEVRFKDIKNLHLSVYPPAGRVTLSAPQGTNPDVIRAFVVARIGWVRRHRVRLRGQAREASREYLERESHYVWGKRCLLMIQEAEVSPSVELQHQRLVLTVRPNTVVSKREAVLESWYRDQLRDEATSLIARWEPLIGVRVSRFFVQRMKTKWGSCNQAAATIRLNTELAKKPLECVEYIIVHEMAHLLERTHGPRFVSILDRALPTWRARREELNTLPMPRLPQTAAC